MMATISNILLFPYKEYLNFIFNFSKLAEVQNLQIITFPASKLPGGDLLTKESLSLYLYNTSHKAAFIMYIAGGGGGGRGYFLKERNVIQNFLTAPPLNQKKERHPPPQS